MSRVVVVPADAEQFAADVAACSKELDRALMDLNDRYKAAPILGALMDMLGQSARVMHTRGQRLFVWKVCFRLLFLVYWPGNRNE